MKRRRTLFAETQGGYTLVEVIITAAIGLVVMSALTSVVLTSYRAWLTASSRVEASSQVRSFEFVAYDDFAQSALPSGNCTSSAPCTRPIVLVGQQASNAWPPSIAATTVTYTWDGVSFLDRQIQGVSTRHAASGVTAFSWYVDGGTSVVVDLTVTMGSYSETQALRFYPRVQP